MKKILAVLFALIFVLSCFAGCGDKKEEDTTEAADSGEVEKEDKDAEEEDEDEDEEEEDEEEETTKKKSKKDDAEEEDEDEEEETTKKKSKKDDAEEEDEDEEETTKKPSKKNDSKGISSPEDLADAYIQAFYVDMDADATLALFDMDLLEVFGTEEGVSADELELGLNMLINEKIKSNKANYDSLDVDPADFDFDIDCETVSDPDQVAQVLENSGANFDVDDFIGISAIVINAFDDEGTVLCYDEVTALETADGWSIMSCNIFG